MKSSSRCHWPMPEFGTRCMWRGMGPAPSNIFSRARSTATLPAIVLLDLNLPKVDGLEVLRQIRADERTAHLALVILTSSDADEDEFQPVNGTPIAKAVFAANAGGEVTGSVGRSRLTQNRQRCRPAALP